ncbi:MAG TPA: prephenate dehydrogenase [Alphaproteobacteria bacterium]|nr:prephenate dehydrogenase [Alphaproteobacteria bacterium]
MSKPSLAIVGCGAFGAFMARHLAPHFDIVLHDKKNVARLAKTVGARAGALEAVAACQTIILAVPVQKMGEVLRGLAPLVKPGALVIDVASVKMKPAALMKKLLPKHVDIVGTHPLFGPQSGAGGIKGLNIAVCNIRGKRGPCVARFCRARLGLNVHRVTPRRHDRELAYVQGITHLLAKVIVYLDLPRFSLTTRTYELMHEAAEFIRYDSDELFRAIERENPFTGKAKREFFASAHKLEKKLRRR